MTRREFLEMLGVVAGVAMLPKLSISAQLDAFLDEKIEVSKFDLNEFDRMLKSHYTKEMVEGLIYADNPMLSLVKKA